MKEFELPIEKMIADYTADEEEFLKKKLKGYRAEELQWVELKITGPTVVYEQANGFTKIIFKNEVKLSKREEPLDIEVARKLYNIINLSEGKEIALYRMPIDPESTVAHGGVYTDHCPRCSALFVGELGGYCFRCGQKLVSKGE